MNIWNWVARRIRLTDPFWGTWFGSGDTYTSRPVTVETALTVSAFWSCVRLISQSIGSLPLPLYVREGDGRRPAFEHPLYSVLHDVPNSEQTSVDFWEGQGASLCIWGNGFARKLRNSRGVIIGLDFLMDQQTTVTRDLNGNIIYRYHDRGKQEDLPPDEVFHIRGFGVGGYVGLSPLAYARQSLSIAQTTEEAQGRMFANGMRAKGFFTFPSVLSQEQRKQAESALVDRYSGPDAKSLGILEAGVKFENTNISPEDAEMLMSRRFSVEDICRYFGVPPIMVGHASEGQTMWGSGVEQLILQFVVMGLRPFLIRIEKAITRSLLLPTERGKYYAEFNLEGLLRGDSAARAQFYSLMTQNGIMTRNECRVKENLPKNTAPAADQLTVQSALVPLEQFSPQQQPRPKLEVVK